MHKQLTLFARNLPIGVVAFVLLFFFLTAEMRDKRGSAMSLRAKLDYLDPFGIMFICGAVTCLLLALQWGGTQHAWDSSRIVGLLVGFVLLFVIFCFIQYKLGERATIPPRLLIHRTILFGSLSSFFITMSNNTVNIPDGCRRFMLSDPSTEIVLYALLLPGNQGCFCGV